MRVEKISTPFNVRQSNLFKNQTNPLRNEIKSDTFERREISFGAKKDRGIIKYDVDWGYQHFYLPSVAEFDAYYPKQRKLNILKGNEEHLKDVAESLCMYDDDDILNFSKIYYPLRLGVNKEKSAEAFLKIMVYVGEQREKLSNLFDIEETLEAKKEQGTITEMEENILRYTTEEIERIDRKCFEARSKYLTSEHLEVDDGSDKSWQID